MLCQSKYFIARSADRCLVHLRISSVEAASTLAPAPKPAQVCNAANTCGSASSPCTVDVKRTANAASSTPGIPNAKSNSLFCVKVGTTVEWKSTGRDIGFVVDFGTASPFDPAGAIIGGTDRAIYRRGQDARMLQVLRRRLHVRRDLRDVRPDECRVRHHSITKHVSRRNAAIDLRSRRHSLQEGSLAVLPVAKVRQRPSLTRLHHPFP